ncbi:DUF1818 family protein [Cyanobium sp. Morenito 9A2]|uniref:DUF1818 family protein n=1 Tax=Cyanobium sp. Morenito 9A2 TaxID=2823718 RepID=UPI0020CD2234|nr:DUF1818 family protein [Cyanobium sp. Morenito 9A2]MCP9849112.1 DUF1818 family protein [Cyanobium sp. Morenito 9A2]
MTAQEWDGQGWRLGFDPQRQPFSVLVGGQGWAVELSGAEAAGLRRTLGRLVAQHMALTDQLMDEETIELELESGPWWLALTGDRQRWALRIVLTPDPGQRALELSWGPGASAAFALALEQLPQALELLGEPALGAQA